MSAKVKEVRRASYSGQSEDDWSEGHNFIPEYVEELECRLPILVRIFI